MKQEEQKIVTRMVSILREKTSVKNTGKRMAIDYAKDGIYKTFQKIGKYIASNTSFGSEQEEAEALEKMLTANFISKLGYLAAEGTEISIQPAEKFDLSYVNKYRRFDKLRFDNVVVFTISYLSKLNGENEMVKAVIDLDNHIPKDKTGQIWGFRPGGVKARTIFYRADYLLGVEALRQLVLSEVKAKVEDKEVVIVVTNHLNNLSEYLTKSRQGMCEVHDLSGHWFREADKKRYGRGNQGLILIEDEMKLIVASEQNLILQQNYNSTMNGKQMSGAYEPKKSLSDKYRLASKQTSLNKIFSEVEFDDDMDFSYVPQMERELSQLMNVLPKSDKWTLPTLRIRKLGKYGSKKFLVSGCYFYQVNTIVLDDGKAMRSGMSTFESFVHEYGHKLDYTFSEDGQLSLQPEFGKILYFYQKKMVEQKVLKMEYYNTPTEVFARAFEFYASTVGVESSFIGKAIDYKIDEHYACFNDSAIYSDLVDYFGKLFPEIKAINTIELASKAEKIDHPQVVFEVNQTTTKKVVPAAASGTKLNDKLDKPTIASEVSEPLQLTLFDFI